MGPCELIEFIRGDANSDGSLGLADAITLLQVLFQSFPTDCESALDIDDSDTLALVDAILLLGNLFGNGAPPAPPYPECGADTTQGILTCDVFPGCP